MTAGAACAGPRHGEVGLLPCGVFGLEMPAYGGRSCGVPNGAMNERDVIERLGPPDEIARREDRMRSRSWICSTCREIVTGLEPIPCPAPCQRCGGIAFETVRAEPS
jgi:hypothetical protein